MDAFDVSRQHHDACRRVPPRVYDKLCRYALMLFEMPSMYLPRDVQACDVALYSQRYRRRFHWYRGVH